MKEYQVLNQVVELVNKKPAPTLSDVKIELSQAQHRHPRLKLFNLRNLGYIYEHMRKPKYF